MKMTAISVAQIISLATGLALIFRLTSLRLHRVYQVFSSFLLLELGFSALLLSHHYWQVLPALDLYYGSFWAPYKVLTWVFDLWIVYSLLDAALANLPGILRFSQNLMVKIFGLAIAIGVVSARMEYVANKFQNWVLVFSVLDRTISTVSLIVMLAILGFLLWFPVEISRNLAIFSIGFIVYFGAKTVLGLARSFNYISVDESLFRIIDTSIMYFLDGCFLFWTVAISASGEAVPVRLGHRRESQEQERLLAQLDAINATLLRSARR
jgi:hypothetical protein